MRNPLPSQSYASAFASLARPASALAFALALVGCGGADEGRVDRVGTQPSAVQGGKTDTSGTHSFAVGIASQRGGVCTGTLIAPNLVLTARHCVVPPDGNVAVTCADKFGKNVLPSQLFVTTEPNLFRARSYYQAKEIITPAENGFCGNDIALVILQESIPADEATPATPVVQFSMTDKERIGKEIAAMGYGITNPSAQDSGQRRLRENIGILCIPGDDSYDCDRLGGVLDSDKEFVTEGWVCSGDSGGGAFEQESFSAGTPYVLGALSRGPQTEDRCLAAIYTRTDAHAEMIIEAGVKAAEAGGYEAPEWIKPLATPADGDPEGTVCEGETCTDTSVTDPAGPLTTTTTTTGCSTASASPRSASGLGAILVAGVLGLVAARRRRCSRI